MGGTHAYVSLSRDPKLACDCAIDDLGIFNRVLDWLIQ